MILGLNAIPGMILTPTLYPYLSRKLGDVKMIYLYSIINMVLFPCFPLTRMLVGPNDYVITNLILGTFWLIRQSAAFFGMLSIQRLINDSVDTKQRAQQL